MGKYRDLRTSIQSMPTEEFDAWLDTAELPVFKGKKVSFDPEEGELNAYDVFEDPDFKKEFVNASDNDKKGFLAMLDALQWPNSKENEFIDMLDADSTPDDPDESSDKPHDEELAGETTPEEDFMQRAVAGKIPATSNVLAGDLTPEEVEMIQMMRAGKKPQKSNGLAGETTPEEKEMFNITNRLAKILSKHRW